MSTSLKISVDAERAKLNFSIPKDIADEFELFVAAAQEEQPKATKNDVLAALLRQYMNKDKAFKAWQKKQRESQQTGGDTSATM